MTGKHPAAKMSPGFRLRDLLAMSFHVFLSHSSADKPAVEELARQLKKEGIEAWLDKWHLIPGDPWQPAIEKALAGSYTCAVFVGPSGLGPWQNEEMRAAIDQRVREPRGCTTRGHRGEPGRRRDKGVGDPFVLLRFALAGRVD